jgi:F5/8 type C domain
MRQEAADYRASLIIDLRRRMTNLSRLRKRLLEAEVTTSGGTDNEINIVGCATIAFSSESPAHPIEHLFDGHSGPGATRWISARPDTVKRIIVEFDEPQSISRLAYEVEETVRERTQEVRVEVSENGGQKYRQILVQAYNFSPVEPPTIGKNCASTLSRSADCV